MQTCLSILCERALRVLLGMVLCGVIHVLVNGAFYKSNMQVTDSTAPIWKFQSRTAISFSEVLLLKPESWVDAVLLVGIPWRAGWSCGVECFTGEAYTDLESHGHGHILFRISALLSVPRVPDV